MPLTRNQRNTSKTSSTSPAADPARPQDLTSGNKDEPTGASTTPDVASEPSRSPSPRAPRLRDRRSLAATKPFGTTVPSDYIANRQAIKRPASTTPPTKVALKRDAETGGAPSSASKVSDQSDPIASSRITTSESNEGLSLLQRPRKPDASPAAVGAGGPGSSLDDKQTQHSDPKHNDYTRAKPPDRAASPFAIEKVIEHVRASLSSKLANRRIDLNESTCSPDKTKIRPPVRITLPSSSPNSRYNLSNNNDLSRPTISEAKQIETINFNSSMLKKNSSNSSNQSSLSREGALNLTASSSNREHIAQIIEKIFNVLIAVTGSVAAVKLLDLIRKLKSMFPQTYVSKFDGKTYKANIRIKIVLTQSSKHFLPTKQKIYETLNDLTIGIHDDADEWSQWKKMGDPVLHIELRKWADIMVIAPLDANTMAKMATGICDNLLTCVVRAWDPSKRLLYCPAMNVHMYNHPLTREQLCKLQSFGYLRIDAVEKRLACGDVGMGAMASVDTIAEKVAENLLRPVSRVGLVDQTILNKQPTYPIMSTNNESNISPQKLLSSLRNKFGAGGQSLGEINSTNGRYNHATAIFGQPHTNAHQSPTNLAITRKDLNSIKTTNGSGQASNSRNNSHRSNLVTSLQNLQAINNNSAATFDTLDHELEDSNEDDNHDIMDESTPESCNSEWSYNGFDPTDVLEQSLITDDSVPNNGFDNNSAPFQVNGSSVTNSNFDGLSRVDRSPFFNTTKFLNICFDKARNCYTCAICKSDYKNRKSMARHLKEQHIQGNIFHCLPCGMSYKRREKLIKHNRERHGFDGIAL